MCKLIICICAYNCMSTLRGTLDSLEYQTDQEFSVMLIVDCSDQDIYSIFKEYKPRLNMQFFRNDLNLGCAMTRQRGLDEARSGYISFLDSDDILLPDTASVWRSAIRSEQPDIICSPFLYDENGTQRYMPGWFHCCHGKVYNIDFMKKHGVSECAEVGEADDSYLNWQAFGFAKSVCFASVPTYVYIQTDDSITRSTGFYRHYSRECSIAYKLALSKLRQHTNKPF